MIKRSKIKDHPFDKLRTGRSKINDGQVMLLTILILSAVFLMTTVIAGLLMVYQLGQVTRIQESAKAIFAADAATERALFNVFRCNHPDPAQAPVVPNSSWIPSVTAICLSTQSQTPDPLEVPKFLNGASYKMTIFTDPPCNGSHDTGAHFGDIRCIKSTGRAGRSSRAFQVEF